MTNRISEIQKGDKFRIAVPEGAEFECFALGFAHEWVSWNDPDHGFMYVPASWCTKVEPPYEPMIGDIIRLPHGGVDEVHSRCDNPFYWKMRSSIATWTARQLTLVYRPEVKA